MVVSSPTYFGILHLLEDMSLRVMEMPSHSEHGMDLDALELALSGPRWPRVSSSRSFDNPNGSLMPQESRARLLALVERHDSR